MFNSIETATRLAHFNGCMILFANVSCLAMRYILFCSNIIHCKWAPYGRKVWQVLHNSPTYCFTYNYYLTHMVEYISPIIVNSFKFPLIALYKDLFVLQKNNT